MILDVLSVCGGKLLFYATVCWGGSIKHKDERHLRHQPILSEVGIDSVGESMSAN